MKANRHVYKALFDQLRRTYTLTGPPVYRYTTPLFDMWTGLADDSDSQLSNWEIKPCTFPALFCFKFFQRVFFLISGCFNDTFPLIFSENTDAKTESATSNDDSPVIISDTTYSSIPPNRELSSMLFKERLVRMSNSLDALMHVMFSATDDFSEADKPLLVMNQK